MATFFFLLLLLLVPGARSSYEPDQLPLDNVDAFQVQVALNLEFLEAEFFLNSVYGYGLDTVAPSLAMNGPQPVGGQKAKLDTLTLDLTEQFALQEVGHLRAIQGVLGKHYFSRPKLDMRKEVFAAIFDTALGETLNPPFDVYANPINYFLGVYVIPYVGLTGYVGANAHLQSATFKRLVAGLLAVEAGQDAVTRQYLYERKDKKVEPYRYTVAEFTNRISGMRNSLFNTGNDEAVDEGLTVKEELGAEKAVTGNVLAADTNSVAFATTPNQIFATVYATGDARLPGGFFPDGAKGYFAGRLLAA